MLEPAPNGTWQATTKVTLASTASFQQAGIILYGDDDNHAKVDVVFAGSARNVEFIRESAGTPRNGPGDSTPAPSGSDTIYLRVISDGTNLTAAYSADGQNCTPVGQVAALAGITTPRVGVYALNGGTTAPDWAVRRAPPGSRPTAASPSPVPAA